jgi:rhomboid protease GluP
MRRRCSWPIITCALIALNLIAWCAVAWVYDLPLLAPQHSLRLLEVGAVNGELLRAGEWWRILTSQFLHVHFPHLIFNLLALLLLGGLLEREFGSWRLLVLYMSSGIVGQIIGVVASPTLVSSGASQAVMGLAGGVTMVSFGRAARNRTRWLIVLLAYLAIQIGLDVRSAGYVKAGHLAGFFAGALIALFAFRPTASR